VTVLILIQQRLNLYQYCVVFVILIALFRSALCEDLLRLGSSYFVFVVDVLWLVLTFL